MPDKFEQIKQKYVNSFEQKFSDINSAWGEKDLPQLESLLHKLAGSSGSYGFMTLHKLCKQANYIIENESEPLTSELENIVQNVLKQLKTH